MKIKKEYINSTPEEIWDLLIEHIKVEKYFSSKTGISYTSSITASGDIYFRGGSGKRSVDGEILKKDKFIAAYNAIEDKYNIDTGIDALKNNLNRQRTPFVGLLLSTGILERD